jgi:drug/metabolite transporter (DMT)-like permease
MNAKHPFRGGTLLALGAAAAFGVTAPLVQRFGRQVGPFTTAALLYGGAALVSIKRRRAGADAAVERRHWPRIAVAAVAGAFLAPVCLAFGLQRATGTSASLMLNLEAVFTVLLAATLLHEQVGGRVFLAVGAMFAGGLVLVVGSGVGGASSWLGLGAVALATLGWALDNVVLRPLADLEPGGVVLRKATLGAAFSLVTAAVVAERWPSMRSVALLVLCGATGYGLSLRLYLHAQRRIGAARTGSTFALAPFLGGVVALLMGQGEVGPAMLVAGALFAVGAYLHGTELHDHRHVHEPLEHEHAHRHDDGHHGHVHVPAVLGEHSHPHRHERLVHDHPHAPDVHHHHRHT